MFAERARSLRGVAAILDVVCIAGAFFAALMLRSIHESLPLLGAIPSVPWQGDLHPSEHAIVLLVNLLVWLIYLRASGAYRPGRLENFQVIIPAYIVASALSVFITGAVVFVLKVNISRLFFGYFVVLALPLLCAKQFVFSRVLRWLHLSPGELRGALVIGSTVAGQWLLEVLRNAPGYRPLGLLVLPQAEPRGSQAPDAVVLGTVDDLDRVLEQNRVDAVFVVGSPRDMAALGKSAEDLVARGCTVSLVPILESGSHGIRGRVTSFQDIPVLAFGPMPPDEVRGGLRRVVDVVVSASALILLSPVLLTIAVAIKLMDRGPVLFRQCRLGLHGEPFDLLKFRSMRTDAERVLREDPVLYRRYEENGFKLPTASDPRVTRLGRFLRRTSLDEFPQFLNVLRGNMALVGPRPIVPDEISRYEPYVALFLSVQPGVTGHWQVSGRSEIAYPERAFMDLDYVTGHSVLRDLRIIIETVPAVLRRRGAD